MAKHEIPTELSPELVDFFKGEKLVNLATVDAESGAPNVNAISWVKSADEKRIRFSVTNNSRIVENIKNNPAVVLNVIGLETVFSIQGKAEILEDTMEGVNLKLSKIEVTVEAVFESMFWGAKITQDPEYVKTYNLEKAKELDNQVYAALMK
ncbi:pyridoxamine 5'-phosphate oxidase family protein [Alkalihalobacillus sp. AL-G]|uniref:pyridoxamine 5'-phosphate oxidase family protein n=1 Tax=Alkalihalobacillus sp. AL-G TaxID=2926399 RepID=UPI00272C5268|nr:pyridoxamine 5'-phosphate oxidase family protein [Alkalihalobacillus sp. AL-G]WLD94824.1 pyridoxamine 5'-phosphate oxidase family protein [Alkalihalobacillus sp. AL-G]